MNIACSKCSHYIDMIKKKGKRCIYGYILHIHFCKWRKENVDSKT